MFYSAGRLAINHYKTGKNSFMWIPYQVFCSPFKRRDIDISICVRAGTYLRKYTKRAHCILWRHWIKSVGTRWRKTAVILGACAHRTCGTWNKAEEKRSKVKRSVGKIKIGGGFAISGQQGGGGAVAGSSFHKPELYGHSGPILPPLQPPAPPDQQCLRNVECRMLTPLIPVSTQDYNTSQKSSTGILWVLSRRLSLGWAWGKFNFKILTKL